MLKGFFLIFLRFFLFQEVLKTLKETSASLIGVGELSYKLNETQFLCLNCPWNCTLCEQDLSDNSIVKCSKCIDARVPTHGNYRCDSDSSK